MPTDKLEKVEQLATDVARWAQDTSEAELQERFDALHVRFIDAGWGNHAVDGVQEE